MFCIMNVLQTLFPVCDKGYKIFHFRSQGGRVKFSGKAADIWAMGVTLFSFVYGKVSQECLRNLEVGFLLSCLSMFWVESVLC